MGMLDFGNDFGALMQQVQQASQPTPEDRRSAQAAQFQALMGSLIGARKGQEGDALGRGGLLSMQAYQNAIHDAAQRRSQTMAQMAAAMHLQQEMRASQMADQQQKLIGQYAQPAAPAMGPPTEQGAMQPGATAGFDYHGYANALAGVDPMKALALEQSLKKEQPEVKEVRSQTDPATGKPVDVIYFKDGTTKVTPFGVGRKMVQANLGGSTAFVDENAMQSGETLQHTQSADNAATVAQSNTNSLRTDARMREQNAIAAQARKDAVDENVLSPGAIEAAAARYNIDGTLPPMGLGKAAGSQRKAVLDRAAELAQTAGVSPDMQRVGQIGNKANATSLGQISKQRDMVGAFEKTFTQNADLVVEQSKKVDRTGVPLANKWIQAGKRAIEGDPELSAFDTVIKATSNEYAKILSGSMGNTAIAEGEIKKTEALLNSAQNAEQVLAVVNMMKRETQNRMRSFDSQIGELKGRMAPAAAASGNSGGWSITPK